MREIKFRSWSKKHDTMVVVDFIDFTEKEITVIDADGEQWYLPFREIEMMQYIGLKDKNGTEIYEGDVIRTESRTGYKRWLVEPMGSEERDGDVFCLCASPWGSGENYFIDNSILKGKVIGNIYENPELLKGDY